MHADTGADAGAERRLHPLSWLFVLLQQLKQFIVPLVAAFFFGGNRNELWPLIGVGVLALYSIWEYFTYRYRTTADSLVIRSGVLHRSLREIPYARIHNVALHQSLLHRLFGVAEVRLESAGGEKPEAQMRVLRLDDAMALEALIRRRAAAGTSPAESTVRPEVLLQLPPREVLRLGLISNRGMVVLAGAFAAATQFNSRLVGNLFERWGQALFGYASAHQFMQLQYVLAIASLLLACLVLVRLLSIVLALFQYHGFRLEESDRRLTVERGLLTRLRTSTPRRRIQAWTLREGLLHRLFKRRSLHVDTAASGQQKEQRAFHDIAPIATPERCDALVTHIVPRLHWPPAGWRGLHVSARWRLALGGVVFSSLLAGVLCWRLGPWGLLGLCWLPWSLYAARQHARRIGYAVDDALVAVREGWWSRHWRFAEIDKLQALRLSRSPLDRRCGTASLWFDTAGAGRATAPLRIRYLPEPDAQALLARLGAALDARPLRW